MLSVVATLASRHLVNGQAQNQCRRRPVDGRWCCQCFKDSIITILNPACDAHPTCGHVDVQLLNTAEPTPFQHCTCTQRATAQHCRARAYPMHEIMSTFRSQRRPPRFSTALVPAPCCSGHAEVNAAHHASALRLCLHLAAVDIISVCA
jgi:hypothetical protein